MKGFATQYGCGVVISDKNNCKNHLKYTEINIKANPAIVLISYFASLAVDKIFLSKVISTPKTTSGIPVISIV